MTLEERIARAMCRAVDKNPDLLCPIAGYIDAPTVPAWMLEMDWVLRFLAAEEELKLYRQERED